MMTQWIVVVSGEDKVEELRKASDNVVSAHGAINEVCVFCIIVG